MVAAFAGWPDAGQAASGAMRFLRRLLGAEKFASIDPQAFFDFTRIRPSSRLLSGGARSISWPMCDFSYARGEQRDLVLFLAPEPHLHWVTFAEAVVDLAERIGIKVLALLGGSFDTVPHSGPVLMNGYAGDPALRQRLQRLRVPSSYYEGPTSIHSAVIQAAHERRVATVSIWGRVPLYVTEIPNPKVSHGLLEMVGELFGFQWDLSDLERAAESFTAQVDEAIEEKPELREYVNRLKRQERPRDRRRRAEKQADHPADEPLAPEAVLRDLEAYLRELREGKE